MRTEAPVLQRCCFCIPLRRGLLAWGYFKLIAASVMFINVVGVICRILNTYNQYDRLIVPRFIVLVVMVAILILDIILHIIFIIGAHKKDTKLFRVYYIYSLTILGLTMLLYFIHIGFIIDRSIFAMNTVAAVSAVSAMFINLCIQAYVIVMVRSEIIKLNNIGQFRFVNNATEAQCTLQLEHDSEIKDEPITSPSDAV